MKAEFESDIYRERLAEKGVMVSLSSFGNAMMLSILLEKSHVDPLPKKIVCSSKNGPVINKTEISLYYNCKCY